MDGGGLMGAGPSRRLAPVEPADARVFVVEDDADTLLVLMKLLKAIGVEHVNWRTTGRRVADFVRSIVDARSEQAPHLILLDIVLPGENGFDVLRDLRVDPRLVHTRVVAVTAHHSPQEVEDARAAGFDGFIGKPIDGRRFPDWIKRLLAGESVWTAVA